MSNPLEYIWEVTYFDPYENKTSRIQFKTMFIHMGFIGPAAENALAVQTRRHGHLIRKLEMIGLVPEGEEQ